MADLRSKFIEDYAGGLLNISRQELASTGEVLSQDGLLSDSTLFVEDGSGVKSGLKLGVSTVEVVDPTTDEGAVNVRYADRTYASTRDLKIFSTAIASAQAALADASSSSITNLENAFQLLEDTTDTLISRFDQREAEVDAQLARIADIDTLSAQVSALESTTSTLSLELAAFTASTTEDIQKNKNAFVQIGALQTVAYESTGGVSTLTPTTGSLTDVRRVAGDYTISGLSTETGQGLDITVTIDATGTASEVVIDALGSGFKIGQKVSVPDTALGNNGGIPLSIEITNVNDFLITTEQLKEEVKKLFNKVNEILTVFQNI